MLKLLKTAYSHEDAFIERYERLMSWALQLTEHNRARAEDLLHDAFILFTLNQPDLNAIERLDGYLYATLRNLHLSQVRRAARVRSQQLSIAQYESAETGLRMIDPRDQIHAQDQLRRICHYGCARKESAKLGSVLILRFFHGYYPSEIVRLLRSTRKAVDRRLAMARAEARLSIEDPKALKFMEDIQPPEMIPTRFARTADDFMRELRQTIFRSKRGECLSGDQLKELYRAGNAEPLECARLAHIVSCPACLDEINKLLGLPLLSDRYPTDTLGNDSRKSGGSGPSAPAGGEPRKALDKWKRGAREAFEHKPHELHISVNGYLQGSQKIGSELSEQSLVIDGAEKINFVEVFSEQGIRLMLLNAGALPPDGSIEQSSQIELSDSRTLSVSLRFSSPWPVVQVVYHDPSLRSEEAAEKDIEDTDFSVLHFSVPVPPTEKCRTEKYGSLISQLVSLWSKRRSRPARINARAENVKARLLQWLTGGDYRLRPGAIAAVIALIAIIFFVRMLVPDRPVSAAELLQRSIAAEETLARKTEHILRRTINLEERHAGGGALIARRRIEIWHSAEKGLAVRRLYDERGELIAGEWRKAGGARTLYEPGAKPRLQPPLQKGAEVLFDLNGVWRLDLSANDFSELIKNAESATVEEKPGGYVIHYNAAAPSQPGGGPVLLKATLALSRPELQATQLSLIVKLENHGSSDPPQAGASARNSRLREYRFSESAFERRAPHTVAPAVFEPEINLLGGYTRVEVGNARGAVLSPSSSPLVSSAATAELEIEALRLLNQAGADLDDQTSLTRTPEGKLRVEGIVETDERKAEILRALAPIRNNEAIIIAIETVAEALRRQRAEQSSSVIVEQIEVEQARIPVDADLRRRFAKEGDRTDERIRQFSAQALNRSRGALSRAATLKRLAGRFSLEDVRNLSAEARDKWLSVLRTHAQAIEQETIKLRIELQPVFWPVAPGDDATEAIEIGDEVGLMKAVERLLESASANDEVIRSAFTMTGDAAMASTIKTPRFWRALRSVERLAAAVQEARIN